MGKEERERVVKKMQELSRESDEFIEALEKYFDGEMSEYLIFENSLENQSIEVENEDETIAGGHSKSTLVNFAESTMTLEFAFSEIIDNIIQNFDSEWMHHQDESQDQTIACPRCHAKIGEQCQENVHKERVISRLGEKYQQKELDVQITIVVDDNDGHKEDRSFIRIEENSGGIPSNGRKSLAWFGDSHMGQDKNSVAVWGWGTKLAITSLGREVQISTHHLNEENPYRLLWTEDWFQNNENESWNVPHTKIKSGSPASTGSTIYQIGKLTDFAKTVRKEDNMSNIIAFLERAYAMRMLDKNERKIKIKIIGNCVASEAGYSLQPRPLIELDKLEETFCMMPRVEPRILRVNFSGLDTASITGVSRTRRLSMLLIIGMSNDPSQDKAGVWMYGNGRLFTPFKPEKHKIGHGWKSAWHAKNRLRVYALFEAEDPRDIPWEAPVKNGFAESHQFYKAVVKTIKSCSAMVLEACKDGNLKKEFAEKWAKPSEANVIRLPPILAVKPEHASDELGEEE